MRLRCRRPQIKIRLVRGADGREGTEVWLDGEVVAQLAPNGLWFLAHNVTVETSTQGEPNRRVAMPKPSDVPHVTSSGIRTRKIT